MYTFVLILEIFSEFYCTESDVNVDAIPNEEGSPQVDNYYRFINH